MKKKLEILKARLKDYDSAVIAFSGGVDSTFLARIAKDVYGENLARFEFIHNEMDKAWGMRDKLTEICRKSGYNYITIDLTGYRTGSMNEVLSDADKQSYQKLEKNK